MYGNDGQSSNSFNFILTVSSHVQYSGPKGFHLYVTLHIKYIIPGPSGSDLRYAL